MANSHGRARTERGGEVRTRAKKATKGHRKGRNHRRRRPEEEIEAQKQQRWRFRTWVEAEMEVEAEESVRRLGEARVWRRASIEDSTVQYESEPDEKERARYQPRVQMAHRISKRQDQDHLRAVLETESRKQSACEIRSLEKSPATEMPTLREPVGTDTADQPSPHFSRGETHPPETDLRKLTRCTRKSGNTTKTGVRTAALLSHSLGTVADGDATADDGDPPPDSHRVNQGNLLGYDFRRECQQSYPFSDLLCQLKTLTSHNCFFSFPFHLCSPLLRVRTYHPHLSPSDYLSLSLNSSTNVKDIGAIQTNHDVAGVEGCDNKASWELSLLCPEQVLSFLRDYLGAITVADKWRIAPITLVGNCTIGALAFNGGVAENSLPVNNAGTINKNNNIWEVPAEEFDNVIDTNVKGIANVLRHFIPLMLERKQGIIVNMSSGWGRSAAAQVKLTTDL
ncbi:hypothetical protein Cgig2_028480 [Carnegiea gigantea]|uniref:Uncharacterized protein n=1 Tax=Carnegiea gigantea TaxID=171969 RepID=A0A9Q1GK49_9CARY|nr:hypothetical protein Cgig2_028480 [Carnegiea gigantea]